MVRRQYKPYGAPGLARSGDWRGACGWSRQGANQPFGGSADAIGLAQGSQSLGVARLCRPRSVRRFHACNIDRDAHPARLLDVGVARFAEATAGNDPIQVLVPAHELGGRLLPYAGHAGEPVGRVAAKDRKVAVRPPRDRVASLDLGLVDYQKPADTLPGVQDANIGVVHQSEQIAIAGDNLALR